MQCGGIRIYGKEKQYDNLPIFSIVTITLNNQDVIEQTIKSVINQDYKNFEYILIDGNSIDKTVEIIKSYEGQIDFWQSESDEGIYDAMNKGIGLSRGIFINFMNAGDVFVNNGILSHIANQYLMGKKDVFYGDFIAIDNKNKTERYIKAKSISKIWKGMIFSHQAAFVNLGKLKEIPFDLKYKIVADYNQVLSLYEKGCTFQYLPIAIAKTSIDGISYSNYKTLMEQMKIVYTHNSKSFRFLVFFIPLCISVLHVILGEKITSKLRKFKWQILNVGQAM